MAAPSPPRARGFQRGREILGDRAGELHRDLGAADADDARPDVIPLLRLGAHCRKTLQGLGTKPLKQQF